LQHKNAISRAATEEVDIFKICAYHYFPTWKMTILHTIFNDNMTYSDKIKAIFISLNCSKIDEMVEKGFIDILSYLIHHTLKDHSNCAENLLLLATSLKTSVKQLFISCSPKLFYILVFEAGSALRKGDQSDEVRLLLTILLYLNSIDCCIF
jgi:hypothetical protein